MNSAMLLAFTFMPTFVLCAPCSFLFFLSLPENWGGVLGRSGRKTQQNCSHVIHRFLSQISVNELKGLLWYNSSWLIKAFVEIDWCISTGFSYQFVITFLIELFVMILVINVTFSLLVLLTLVVAGFCTCNCSVSCASVEISCCFLESLMFGRFNGSFYLWYSGVYFTYFCILLFTFLSCDSHHISSCLVWFLGPIFLLTLHCRFRFIIYCAFVVHVLPFSKQFSLMLLQSALMNLPQSRLFLFWFFCGHPSL